MHSLKDAELTRTLALPDSGNSASSQSIDLSATEQSECHFQVEIKVPALANLADAKSVTVTLEDSADDAAFAAIDGLAPLVVTGSGGGGSAADSLRVRLPNTAQRYLRATADVEAAGGDNTADSLTLGLIF